MLDLIKKLLKGLDIVLTILSDFLLFLLVPYIFTMIIIAFVGEFFTVNGNGLDEYAVILAIHLVIYYLWRSK